MLSIKKRIIEYYITLVQKKTKVTINSYLTLTTHLEDMVGLKIDVTNYLGLRHSWTQF